MMQGLRMLLGGKREEGHIGPLKREVCDLLRPEKVINVDKF